MTPDQQVEILLRGTLFADEVEGGQSSAVAPGILAAGDGDPNAARPGGPARTLRQQMSEELRERLRKVARSGST